ncbi:MAG: cell envelope biogenesis protein OmpA [Deltaproteobacteria bacterium SM23_61]|nr:MAG: cell envelope biogenesis protein OmpA [Deltaproteobacteria bacterium SM23_61]
MPKILAAFIVIFLAGCGYQRPVLYPNAQLKQVGEAQAQTDIAECMEMAEAYVKSNPEAKVVGSTAAGAGAGAAVGGAMGAVTGNLGRGAAIGAAGGAVAGIIRGASRASRPSPTYKNFVNRCLREKGYEPIGWE